MNRVPWGACPPQRSVPSASIRTPTLAHGTHPLRDQSLSVPSSTATRAPNAGTDHSPGSNTIAPPSFAPRVLPRSARPLTSTAPLDLHEPRPATPLSTNTRFASSLRPKRSHAAGWSLRVRGCAGWVRGQNGVRGGCARVRDQNRVRAGCAIRVRDSPPGCAIFRVRDWVREGARGARRVRGK